MENFKNLLASKAIWANILTAIAGIAAVWGFNLSPEVQNTIVSAIVLIGPGLAGVFRFTAKSKLTMGASDKGTGSSTGTGSKTSLYR